MFYSYKHSVTTGNVVATPARVDMHLSAGIVHQVDILFQDGCNHGVNVQIFQGDHQLFPSNRGATLLGNATIISFREFHELEPGENVLIARIWGDGIITGKDVIINIGVLPKTILQPLSFNELLKAITE